MLCNSILLGSIPDSMLAKNAILGGEIDEGIAHILPSLVIVQNLDLLESSGCFSAPLTEVLCDNFKAVWNGS